jgi:hypothetical protein
LFFKTMKEKTMRAFKITFGTLALVGAIVAAVMFGVPRTKLATPDAVAQTPQTDKDAELGKFILDLMQIVRSDLSAPRRQILARTIVRVSNDVFLVQEHKKYFAILVSIESKFDNSLSSPVGALGLSQLMPQYVPEFGKMCGISPVKPDDVARDPELNLTLGACLFRSLIEEFSGNAASALVAYNAGKASLSLKQLHSLHNITNEETSNYLAKFLYISEKVKQAQAEAAAPEPKTSADQKTKVKKGSDK